MTHWPPNSCMPNRAKTTMKRKRRNSRLMIDFMELSRDTTRFLNEFQYLHTHRHTYECMEIYYERISVPSAKTFLIASGVKIKNQKHIFIYPSILFWCELLTFGNISHRDVYLLCNIMEQDGTTSVPKQYI